MTPVVPVNSTVSTDGEPLDDWEPEATVAYGQPPVLPPDEEMNQRCCLQVKPSVDSDSESNPSEEKSENQ